MNKVEDVIKPRIVAFDLLRVSAITIIINSHFQVILHKGIPILSILTPLAVPIFFLLSFYLNGKYFLSNRQSLLFLLHRVKRLFIPFLFWSVFSFILRPELITSRALYLQFITGSVVDPPLYFLVLLIVMTAFFWLLTYIPLRARIAIFYVLIFFCFYIQYSGANYLFFSEFGDAIINCYGRLIDLLPFALIGVILSQKGIAQMETATTSEIGRKLYYVLFHFLVVFSFIQFLFFYKASQTNVSYSGLPVFLATVALFLFVLTMKEFYFRKKFLNILIYKLGKYSFGIYLFHFPLLKVLTIALPSLKTFVYENPTQVVLLFVVLCYSLCLFFEKLTIKKQTMYSYYAKIVGIESQKIRV